MTRKIRVVSPVDDPFANDCFPSYPADPTCKLPGIEIEYLYIAFEKFLRHEIQWIQVDNYTAMDNYLEDGTADIQGISQPIDSDFFGGSKQWGYTPIFLRDAYTLILRETVDFEEDPFGVFKVFSWELWLAFLGCFFAYAGISWLSSAFSRRFFHFDPSPCSWVRSKLFGGACLLVLAVFMSVFTNIISIDLIIRKKASFLPFYSFEEFHTKLKSGDCRWVMPQAYANDEEFWPAIINPGPSNIHPWAQGFRDAYKKYQPVYVESRDDMIAEVKRGDVCRVGIDYVSVNMYYESRYCGIKMVPEMPMSSEGEGLTQIESLPRFNFVYYTATNSTWFLPQLDQIFNSDSMAQLYPYFQKKYYKIPYPPQCKSQFSAREFESMRLAKVLGTFYLLIGALAATLPIIGLEILFGKKKIGVTRRSVQHSQDLPHSPKIF